MDRFPGSIVVTLEMDHCTYVSEGREAKLEPTPLTTNIKKEPVDFDSGETEAKLKPSWPAFDSKAGVYLMNILCQFRILDVVCNYYTYLLNLVMPI